ncbi:hypothetical protein QYM36_008760 [Artemia franciscana]|uniref:Ankyrin-3 n=1 Tax=Artemia franciscana TaxID=6661 RepID=A0AA88HUE3_ARTSF|nr:hypothetical protein QYM36_008760 [Artemia franciscana]
MSKPKVTMMINEDINYCLINAVREGNLEKTRELLSFNNPFGSTNLVILACEHNKVNILEYLLSSNGKILSNFSLGAKETAILPSDEDETCHNAFYYAIRSSNVELLDTLIGKWPGNYFAVHLSELDEILSRNYEELKLKNVLLSEEMEFFVENKLIDLRFFSNSFQKDKNVKSNLNSIRERIELLLQNVIVLRTEYCNREDIDEKFIFIAKFVAQNLHILKRQLKSSYERLPWEEMEFCLISFVSSHLKRQEINLFLNAILNKNKILNHLEHFSRKLKEEKDYLASVDLKTFAKLPNLNRQQVVANIISSFPQFGELYRDYQQIRDIQSLKKISDYIKLALSAELKQKEDKLIIARALQVTGEHLKNTLESPRLSKTTSDLLLLSLPRDTRQIIIDLRNSLSHAYSLSKRIEIEDNANINFIGGVQNDLNRIDDVIRDIFQNKKMQMIRRLLVKIKDSESLEDIKEVAVMCTNVELDDITKEWLTLVEHDKLEKLIQKFKSVISEKTDHEKRLFNKIENILYFSKTKSIDTRHDSSMAIMYLKGLFLILKQKKNDQNYIRKIKFHANKILENIPLQIESHNLEEISKVSREIYLSVRLRKPGDNIGELDILLCQILKAAEFKTSDMKWVEELRNKLCDTSLYINKYKKQKSDNITEEKYNSLLECKLSDLKGVLKSNTLYGTLKEEFSFYKRNKKLLGVVEMLVLDILCILSRLDKNLENTRFFLEENTPLLTGKCLRNHLAHYNDIVDVLSSDPSIAIILNAKKLITENVRKSKIRISKSVKDNPPKLKNKYDQNIDIITNQEKMFAALKEGNLEDLKICLRKGADINGRSINSTTSLHFAAQGPSVEVLKFVADQHVDVNIKDLNGQNALHVAAGHGKKNIVEFLIRKKGVHFDDPDNNGKTALHAAAENGYKDAAEVLLKNNANTNIIDSLGYSPLHYSVENDYIDIAKILLRKELNVDSNETMGGLTSLHISASRGHLELVNFLLKNKAIVNSRNDLDETPLHFAAINGHFKVVKALIQQRANVNALDIDSSTPLHHAAEHGHEQIVDILIEYGANVNSVNKVDNIAPLHYAAMLGHEKLVSVLLKNNASVNISTLTGLTPLHLAVQGGQAKTVVTLLEYGANICAKDKYNATPLHHAVEFGHKAIVQLLISNGVKINDVTDTKRTPLHLAALKGKKDIIELLLRNKAEVGAQDIKGETALHLAVLTGTKDVIALLLKNKAEVNARNNIRKTPLHTAAENENLDAIGFLIDNKAEINAKAEFGYTPLDAGVLSGNKHAVKLLLENNAEFKNNIFVDRTESAPLHYAVDLGHKEIVEILVAKGADVNINYINQTPLILATKKNHTDIVKFLIENGANVNTDHCKALFLASQAGFRDIVEMLLKNKGCVNIGCTEDNSAAPLHFAAIGGHTEIINLLIAHGATVDAITTDGSTPLYLTVEYGHEEATEVLISNKANINIQNIEGMTPLHVAAADGYANVVEILLRNGAKINIKDIERRTPLELAVANGHLEVVKILLQNEKIDINAKGTDDLTVLHIASQENRLEIVRYLVSEGSNINAKNKSGSKSIHIAAREGHKDTVQFFLRKGININDAGKANQTLLHYAAFTGHLEVIKYLISKGADVNAKDNNGVSPMHIAANYGYKDVIIVLLENGAIYNLVDKLNRKPVEMSTNKDTIDLFASTEMLIKSVKRNSCSEVENCIKAGAIIDARNIAGGTSLHFAAWKGYEGIVKILLQNKANPNVLGIDKYTPLHYSAKFSHLKIVKLLLSHGAVYNYVSDSGKTPSDFCVDKDITMLFDLICESFEKVNKCNIEVIHELNKIKEVDTIKAIMSACDRDNQTLVIAAIQSNFPKVQQLKEIFQKQVSAQIDTASFLFCKGSYQKALAILKSVFERRKEILGPNNPGTLDIQAEIAKVLYRQGMFQEALNVLEDIVQKQSEMLGLNHKDTLGTRRFVALVLHRQGENEKSLDIYEEVYKKQKEILGLNHSDTLNTIFHMSMVLSEQGKLEEALKIFKEVFEMQKEALGANNIATVNAKNNIAMVLSKQGKLEEALEIFKEVFEKKKIILGVNHTDAMRTQQSIAGVLLKQCRYREALNTCQEVLSIQKKVLKQNHPKALRTQCNIGDILFAQGKWIGALRVYKECFDQIKAVFGPNHPITLDILIRFDQINSRFKVGSFQQGRVFSYLQKDLNIAASIGDIQTVQSLLNDGADPNETDINGRTSLHNAVDYGHINIVNILLNYGAIVNKTTNKGNTPLHIATSKGYKEIVDVLLENISRDKLNDFINAKTTVIGTTSLHIAAKNGSLEILKSLLTRGAIYNIKNKHGKLPIDLSKHQKVINLLKLIEELFRDIRHGNVNSISKLERVKLNDVPAITNARNNQGDKLLIVAIANGRKNVASKLLEMLKIFQN